MMAAQNSDPDTIAAFGDEWTRFDQTALPPEEAQQIFRRYFGIFPWEGLPPDAEGFDMGCGSGRWAALVAPRVGRLNCIDASPQALAVARRQLADCHNVRFIEAGVGDVPLAEGSQDFGYSLGVLHHVPDTRQAVADSVKLLKPGAPFLLYLYYRFDNRPLWFRAVWRATDFFRAGISRLPPRAKHAVTDAIAAGVYLPLARAARLGERLGLSPAGIPLSFYRDKSFYTMRTDSRDRFGTPLEQRFTRAEIGEMMTHAGLTNVVFSEEEPFWVARGIKQ